MKDNIKQFKTNANTKAQIDSMTESFTTEQIKAYNEELIKIHATKVKSNRQMIAHSFLQAAIGADRSFLTTKEEQQNVINDVLIFTDAFMEAADMIEFPEDQLLKEPEEKSIEVVPSINGLGNSN